MLADKEQSIRAFLLIVHCMVGSFHSFNVSISTHIIDSESESSSSTLTPKSKHPAAAENLVEKSQVELSMYSV